MTPTPRQAMIVGWLRRVNAHASDMYESALWLAADERIPCRGRMIAHAYREICSMLMNEHSSNSREPLETCLEEFADEYRKLNIRPDVPAGSSPVPDVSPTPVPDSFLSAAGAVVRVNTTTDNARARSRAIFERVSRRHGPQPDVGPTSDRWYQMSRFFQARAHDRKTLDAQMMEGQFRQEVDFFEETLSALAETAVTNLNALDQILEDANS
jgi:hypothetical protein